MKPVEISVVDRDGCEVEAEYKWDVCSESLKIIVGPDDPFLLNDEDDEDYGRGYDAGYADAMASRREHVARLNETIQRLNGCIAKANQCLDG